MLLCGARSRFTEIPAYDAKMRLTDVADQQLFRIIVKYGVTPFCRVRADSLSLCKVADEDWRTIQEMFDKEHKWMTTQMQKHIREVNQMFYEERRRVQERYKEYDGTYLGHYVQYFFWFFFVLGLVIFGLAIFLMLDSHYHWTPII